MIKQDKRINWKNSENKRFLNQRVEDILLIIHRGFLEDGDKYSDEEILANVPRDGTTWKVLGNDERILVNKPFTYRQVRKAVKQDWAVKASDILKAAGFA